MRRKNIIKKVAAAVMTAVMLFSGAAICEHSVTQQDELVAEAASDDYGSGVVLRAKKGQEVYMSKGVRYYSPKKNYYCIFQNDGNFVVYRYRSWLGSDQPSQPVWATKTYGNPNATCVLQKDGNFVIYGYDSRGFRKCLYTSLTVDKNRKSDAVLHLSRKGNLYITHGGKEKWSTKEYPEQKYRYINELDWVQYVGEWHCTQIISGLTNSDNKITIDFPENGKMKVTLYHCTNQKQNATYYIKCDSIREYGKGNKKYVTDISRNLADDYDADIDIQILKQLFLGEDGETISLKSNVFHRIYSH